jgi:bifunctional non-homologous end joining protein LigD
LVIREQDRVRLINRGGHDWAYADRHGRADAALGAFRDRGERVAPGTDGISDFDALHPSKHNVRAQLYAQASVSDRGSIASQHPERSQNYAKMARLGS